MWKEPCPDCGAWGAHYCTGGQKEDWEAITEQNYCTHPEHLPPSMMVIYHPYIHICPSCGYETIVKPNMPIC